MISIPDSLFRPKKNDDRLGKVFIYALNAYTIGITPEYCPDWDKVALYRKTWKVRREGSNWRLDLPLQILRFYLMRESGTKIVKSINGGNIIVTVTRR